MVERYCKMSKIFEISRNLLLVTKRQNLYIVKEKCQKFEISKKIWYNRANTLSFICMNTSPNPKTIGEKYYIHSIVLAFVLFLQYFFGMNHSILYTSVLNYSNIESDPFDGVVYPIEYVPNPVTLTYDERKRPYTQIPSKDFIPIPLYDPSLLGKNPENIPAGSAQWNAVVTQRLIYTVLYMGNYNFDYREYAGSHVGVDIIAPLGTPLRNIANGVVIKTGFQAYGFGNFAVVKHSNVPYEGRIQTIYSVYSHMSENYAKEGTKIKKWEIVGLVGKTGTATTEHVHFQIDRDEAPFHPYWPFTGEEQRKSGLSFFDATSAGLGKSDGIKYTIHPMHFLHQHLNFSAPVATPVVSETPKVEEKAPESVLVKFDPPANNETPDTPENTPPIIPENHDTPASTDGTIPENNDTPTIPENTWTEPIHTDPTPEPSQETPENTPPAATPAPEEIIEENIPVAVREEIANHDLELLSTLSVDNWLKQEHEGIEKIEQEIRDVGLPSASTSQKMNDDELLAALAKALVSQPVTEENKNPIIARMPWIDEVPVSQTPANTIFADIPDSHPYAQEIAYLKSRNIISGFVDNTFRPKNNITRIESLKIILLAHQSQPTQTTQTYFSDVSGDSWENGYVAVAIGKGIIDGNNTKFFPFRTVSRAEALKLIFTLGNIAFEDIVRVEIDDIAPTDWEYKYAQYAVENNLFTLENGKFFPSKALTREELARLVYRYLR